MVYIWYDDGVFEAPGHELTLVIRSQMNCDVAKTLTSPSMRSRCLRLYN